VFIITENCQKLPKTSYTPDHNRPTKRGICWKPVLLTLTALSLSPR